VIDVSLEPSEILAPSRGGGGDAMVGRGGGGGLKLLLKVFVGSCSMVFLLSLEERVMSGYVCLLTRKSVSICTFVLVKQVNTTSLTSYRIRVLLPVDPQERSEGDARMLRDLVRCFIVFGRIPASL
jgi:hypothetical protein